jgi:Ca2+-binding RTX toxin-like protein
VGEGTDTVVSSIDYTLGANVENLSLTGTAISATGNAAANVLDGKAGADTLIGGLGDDTYVVDNAADVVTENASEGTDLVNASVSYALADNLENLTLTGSAAINGTGNALANVMRGNNAANVLDGGSGNDAFAGNGGNDTLIGGAGNDSLNGGAGADAMSGGIGDDTYTIDNALDTVSENVGEGTDTVVSSIDYTLGANVENLSLTGTAISATGNGLNNAIRGTSAANVLDGGAGADKLYGYGGDDTYIVDTSSDRTAEIPGGGTDTVMSSATYTLFSYIENLTLTGSSALGGTGNIEDNVLTGNDAANTLNGVAGNDTLIGNGGNDWLDGGTGADTMTGGLGNDTYTVDNVLDTITENVGEGTDLVRSSISYTLGANVENLTLLGSANIDGTGNALANALRGNAGNNILDGGAGADKMYGYGGDDTFIIDNAGDGISEAAGGGTDTALAS